MLDHFELAHHPKYTLFRDFTYAIWENERDTNNNPRRQGISVSASMTGGCWREAALKRTVGWWLDPLNVYQAMEGTLIHESLPVPWPWEREVVFNGTILGGMEFSGVIDRLNRVGRCVRDIKTHKAPAWKWKYPTPDEKAMGMKPWVLYDTKEYPPGEGEVLQVNVLMRLVEVAEGVEGAYVPPYGGEIVPIFKGTNSLLATRVVQVPRMTDAALIARIRPYYDQFITIMSEPDLDKRLALISFMELQGRKMFNSRDGSCKCDKYCSLREACDKLLPKVNDIDLSL